MAIWMATRLSVHFCWRMVYSLEPKSREDWHVSVYHNFNSHTTWLHHDFGIAMQGTSWVSKQNRPWISTDDPVNLPVTVAKSGLTTLSVWHWRELPNMPQQGKLLKWLERWSLLSSSIGLLYMSSSLPHTNTSVAGMSYYSMIYIQSSIYQPISGSLQ